MKHDKYKELLELNVLGELTQFEEIELENHLFECSECAKEYAEIKKLYTLISTERTSIPSENSLMNARKRLFNTISSEAEQIAEKEKTRSSWFNLFGNKYAISFGTIALVLIGFFIGYLLFNNPTKVLLTDNSIDLDKINEGAIKIANINFPDKFSDDGEFEFQLDDQKSTSYKGTLNDVIVQKLLAMAVKETENPGFKIKTAKSFSELLPNNFTPDNEIKQAFINSLKTDKNPGVRKGALQALLNFQYDEEIRDALIYVLEEDENASNRMSAINALLSMNLSYLNLDEDVMNKLNQKNINEENEVIKYRTAKLLIGGKSNEK